MSGLTMKSLVRIGLLTALPFALLGLFLGLHKLGKVDPIKGLTYEATLILNLGLYWLVLFLVILFLRNRARALASLKAQGPQVALLAFSLLLSGAFAELAIRLVRPDLAARPFERWPSPTLHHVNAPNRSSLGMGMQRVITNADGFRTPYDREGFLDHRERIVLLGDSYTFGLGVAAEEAVGSILEQRLREHLAKAGGGEDAVAVLNTGVISYSPFLELQNFRQRARAYEPTLTLLLLDANDIGDDYQYAQENVAGPGEEPRFDVPPLDEGGTLCDLSALCRALGPLWDRLGKPLWVARRVLDLEEPSYDYYDFVVDIGGEPETNRFFILRYPMADTRPFLDATWAHIEAVAREVQAAGSEFGLVIMPRYFHWNDEECPENWESDRYGVDEPHENVMLEYFDMRAPAAPFPVWSLLPPFQNASGPLVFAHDPHWNSTGHQVAGETLAKWLIEAGWPGDWAPGARLSFSSEVVDQGDSSSGMGDDGEAGEGDSGSPGERLDSESNPPRLPTP